MGSPKIEAFLVLEATVARTVTASWDPIARQAIKAISTALAANRFDEAYDIAERITLANVVEQQRRRLEELATSALLFGASRLVDLQSTALMSGKPLPSLVDMALNQLVAMIEEDAADNVRAATVKIIGRAEESFKHGQLAVEKAEFDLADALNAAVLGTGRGLIDVGANLTTSRLVSFGFLDQAVELQIDTYQVSEILDGRHCAVCEIMHGKTFEVRHEHARVERVLQILDPAELKTAAPWPRQDKESLQILRGMSTSDMQNAGFGSPPYHPLCRGVSCY